MHEDASCAVDAPSGSGRESIAAAVAALGLVSSWGAGSAYATDSTITITLNGTVTVGLVDVVSFFSDNATLTLDPPRQSVGDSWGDLGAGTFGPLAVDLTVDSASPPIVGSSFMGAIDNGDGTSDLVLGFVGDGSIADGVAWTSLFVDNLPDEERVFEPQVLAQLASDPVFSSDGLVEPDSQLDRIDRYFRDLLVAGLGDELTLVGFNGPGNTGVLLGSVIITPAPASALLFMAGVIPLARRRRV